MASFFRFFPWYEYSKALKVAILEPTFAGIITEEEAEVSEMRLVIGSSGRVKEGILVKIYLLVDENDGLIVDAKFQAFAESALIGALQALCGLVLRKNYHQAAHIGVDLIDKHLRDDKAKVAFPLETLPLVQFAVSALKNALEKCEDIPFASDYVPPVPFEGTGEGEALYPNFLELTEEQKRGVLLKVIDEDVRPYIELDNGGVDVTGIAGYRITITYKGSCTSCYSSIGATLNGIQAILRSKINPHIEVIPDMSTLKL